MFTSSFLKYFADMSAHECIYFDSINIYFYINSKVYYGVSRLVGHIQVLLMTKLLGEHNDDGNWLWLKTVS